LDGQPTGEDAGFVAHAGSVLRLGQARRGLRSYVAVRGGIDVATVLGSRSTDTLAFLGPQPLAAGNRLPVGAQPEAEVQHEPVPTRPPSDAIELRLMPGPRDDRLTEAGLHQLFATGWQVTSTSDRTGLRLDGPALERAGTEELLSEGMVAGAVQVPPDGKPILFLSNAPTTGGYPVVGVVLEADLAMAGQARPGSSVRFRRVAPPTL
ncbi:MAG: hypothetical protein QOC98_3207, partial [Frankiaceae bacterium]|nr:hypothetical protein [Frankiaceae bacterium]